MKTYKSIVNENIKPVPLCSIKWQPFKIFGKLHESHLLTATIVTGTVSDLAHILATECYWNVMKNVFYYSLKAPFVVKMFKFLSLTFWSCRKNCLIRKIMLMSKFVTSQPDLQTITIYMLPNISRSKGHHTINLAS